MPKNPDPDRTALRNYLDEYAQNLTATRPIEAGDAITYIRNLLDDDDNCLITERFNALHGRRRLTYIESLGRAKLERYMNSLWEGEQGTVSYHLERSLDHISVSISDKLSHRAQDDIFEGRSRDTLYAMQILADYLRDGPYDVAEKERQGQEASEHVRYGSSGYGVMRTVTIVGEEEGETYTTTEPVTLIGQEAYNGELEWLKRDIADAKARQEAERYQQQLTQRALGASTRIEAYTLRHSIQDRPEKKKPDPAAVMERLTQFPIGLTWQNGTMPNQYGGGACVRITGLTPETIERVQAIITAARILPRQTSSGQTLSFFSSDRTTAIIPMLTLQGDNESRLRTYAQRHIKEQNITAAGKTDRLIPGITWRAHALDGTPYAEAGVTAQVPSGDVAGIEALAQNMGITVQQGSSDSTTTVLYINNRAEVDTAYLRQALYNKDEQRKHAQDISEVRQYSALLVQNQQGTNRER